VRLVLLNVRLLLALGLLAVGISVSASAQNIPQPGLPPVSGQPGDQDAQRAQSKMEREMAKKAAKERQAAIKRDTDKLLELATELKDNVDKSSENTLSMDVVKKAEEIEKLAKSVKEKMKGN
jgi:hypothetical protein